MYTLNGTSHLDKRRMYLLEQGQQLVRRNIIRCYNEDLLLHQKIKQNMIAVLPELNTGIEQRTPAPNNKKTGRCYICPRKIDKNLGNIVVSVQKLYVPNIRPLKSFVTTAMNKLVVKN
jgi:hypothetical protein